MPTWYEDQPTALETFYNAVDVAVAKEGVVDFLKKFYTSLILYKSLHHV
jgi:hypothetical protein